MFGFQVRQRSDEQAVAWAHYHPSMFMDEALVLMDNLSGCRSNVFLGVVYPN